MAGLLELENETQGYTFVAVLHELTINDERPCQVATFSAHIQDPGDDYVFLSHDLIRARWDGVQIFAGDVSRYVGVANAGLQREWLLTARDFTARLRRDVIKTNRKVVESIDDRIAWIMSHCTKRLRLDPANAAMSTELDALDSAGMTVLEALAQTAGEVGASFYVTYSSSDPTNYDGEVRFFRSLPANPAPFDLRSSASPSWNVGDPQVAVGASLDTDAEAHATVAYVKGDNVAVTEEDAAAIAEWSGIPGGGRIELAIIDPNIKTEGQASRVGQAALDLRREPTVRGHVKTQEPGLEPMMTATFDHPTLDVDATFIILKTTTTLVDLVRLETDVELADRFTPCYLRGVSSAQAQTAPKPDCTVCPSEVILLPSGMDEDLSLARGKAGMHVFDRSALVAYDCAGQKVRQNDSVGATGTLDRVYHEPGIYTGLLLGNRVVHLDPDLGPYGTARWTISDDVTAADVMDIRQFWAVVTDGLTGEDTFTRTTVSDNPGTSDGGIVWDSFVSGGGHHHIDGARYNFEGVPGTTTQGQIDTDSGLAPRGDTDFMFLGRFRLDYAPSGGFDGGYLQVFAGLYPDVEIGVDSLGNGGRYFGVYGSTYDERFDVVVDSGVDYMLRWEHQGATGLSRAKVWKASDSEPSGWMVSRSFDPDDEPLDSYIGAGDAPSPIFGLYVNSWSISDAYWNYIEWTGGVGLQSRSMVDGSLIATVGVSPTTQIRRTPNGQHVFVLQGNSLVRYSRSVVLEDTVTIAGFATGLQDWNVDDAYNIYRLAGNVLRRYDSGGDLEWTKNLNTLYGYRFPSLMTMPNMGGFGSGQQVVTFDNKLRVVGYDGPADWTDGSEALLLSLHPATGALISERRFRGATGDAAQAEAVQPLNDCLWLVGAAEGSFIGTALTGRRGWLYTIDAGDAGGVVSVIISDEAP